MLVTSTQLLLDARAEGYAVGAFNTYNLEITQGILRGAEEQRAPVFLQVGAAALDYGGAGLAALSKAAAEAAAVPVALHLDHARSLGVLTHCLGGGFTSVMFDGSELPFGQNVTLTREAAALAHAAGVPIEAELGTMAGDENGGPRGSAPAPFTDPDQAVRFVAETGIDSLAVAIGNAHGFYKGEPRLDLERLRHIHRRVKLPLVLHGASGIPGEAIQQAVEAGICKINVNTDLRCAFFDALAGALAESRPDYNLPRLFAPAIEAVARVVADHVALFGSAGKSRMD